MKTRILMLALVAGWLLFSCGAPSTIAEMPTHPDVAQTPTLWPTYPPPMPATYYLGFCQAISPFDKVEARKAFGLAIDRQALALRLFTVDAFAREFARAEPATSFVPPDIWPDGQSRFGKVGLKFDPASANGIIQMSPHTFDPAYTLATPDGSQNVAEFLQSQWRGYLDIDVKPVTLGEGNAYMDEVSQCNYPMFLLGWYADYKSPYNFLFQCFHSTKSFNSIKWKNPEFDQAVEDAYRETDPARQTEMYMQAEKILTETDVVIVPLFHYYYNP